LLPTRGLLPVMSQTFAMICIVLVCVSVMSLQISELFGNYQQSTSKIFSLSLVFWIGAVPASVLAAVASLQKMLFGKNHQSVVIEIIILLRFMGFQHLFLIHGLANRHSLYLGQN
jgi:hypothetical protein